MPKPQLFLSMPVVGAMKDARCKGKRKKELEKEQALSGLPMLAVEAQGDRRGALLRKKKKRRKMGKKKGWQQLRAGAGDR